MQEYLNDWTAFAADKFEITHFTFIESWFIGKQYSTAQKVNKVQSCIFETLDS